MPRRRAAQPLTGALVLEAALQLVNESGMAALTMRRLGARLGVDPMAVYYYFPNKQALLAKLVEEVFLEMRPIASDGAWQSRVAEWANAYRDLALAYPHLVLQIATSLEAANVATSMANPPLYAALHDSGLDTQAVKGAGDTLVDYVNGFVLFQVDGDTHGATVEAAFRFSVELIIGGIERLAKGG